MAKRHAGKVRRRKKGFEIVVAQDLGELSDRAAAFVVEYLRKLGKMKRRISVSLAGGMTPGGLYERLSSERFQGRIPWRQVHLFWGDERCVPLQHKESNYRLAYEALISKMPIPRENVHPIEGDFWNPDRLAQEYETMLRQFFRVPKSRWPRFDLVILGMGPDGHTASLFPDSSALKEKKRWVVAPYVEKLNAYRLTLTPPVFNHAAQIIFLVSGPEKASVLKEGLTQGRVRSRYPYRLISPKRGKMLFFLDSAAASLIIPPQGQ